MIRLCISEYLKNIKRNIVSVILLTATMSMILLTIGNLRESYKYYKHVKPYLSDKGICTIDTMNMGAGDIRKKLDNTEGVDSYKLFSNTFLFVNKIKSTKALYLLDEIEEKTMIPGLRTGKWSNGDSKDFGTIHVLVTENDEDMNVGDEMEVQYYTPDGTARDIKIKIDGVIKDGERIPGYILYPSMSKISFESFNGVFDLEQNEESVFVSTQQEWRKLGDAYEFPPALGIIRYDDKLTDSQITDLTDDITKYFLSEEGSEPLGNVQLSLVNDNSKAKINKIIMKFIPFAIVAFVLSIICSMASSAVDALEGTYRYTVYYLTGMKWSSCLKLSGFSAIGNVVLTLALSSVTIWILKLRNVAMVNKINFGMYELSAIGVLCVFFFCTSVIMPMVILKKERPSNLLKNNM